MDRVRRLIEAQAAYRLSLYGEGVGVAVVDSGINDRHPDLKGRVVLSLSFTLRIPSDAADDCGHGTRHQRNYRRNGRGIRRAGTRDLRRGAILFP